MLKTATNPKTGEIVALVGDEWKPVSKTASNDAGQKAYLINNQWVTDDGVQSTTQDKGFFDESPLQKITKPQNIINPIGGVIGGAAKSLGALVSNPIDMAKAAIAGEGLTGAKRNIADRRASIDAGLQSAGVDTSSLGYKGAELATEIAGTSGIPVALGGRVAKEMPRLGSAIKSGGLTLGGKAATTAVQKVANAAIRGVGGAVSGGAMTLAVDPEKTGTGAAIGAAIPVVGMAAGAVGKKLGERAASKAQALAPRQQEFAVAKEANKLGYVIPPADLRPSAISEIASGVSGKIKTAQVASQKNQLVTNSLVKKSLGLSDDAPLNAETLNQIRQEAGNAYQAVADIGTVTPSAKYAADLDEAIKPFIKQAQSFPNRKVSAVVDDIKSLKTNSFDAGDAIETIKVLRNDADAAYRSGDKLAGKAYKKAAETLENAIDDQLVVNGVSSDVLNAYRNARKTIAKTYTVEGALNAQTGNVNAAKLATQLNKKKPLDGELLQVAKIADAFPKATQMLKETPKAISPLDFYAAGGVAAGTGNVLPLAMIGARPAIRGALLSKTAQRSAIKGLDKTSMATKLLSKAPNTKASIGVARTVPIASLYE
jgi:hypothetical protein